MLQDKSGPDENADACNASQQGGISTADTVGSPVAAQAIEQAQGAQMADAVAASTPETDTQEADASMHTGAASTTAQQRPQEGGQLSAATSSATDYAQIGSQLLSLSSESLSALPTPLHPAAVPPAVAQELNNELARSLLQEPQTTGLTGADAHSVRLTSAYSGPPSRMPACLATGRD